jgi:hypothetical protein
MHASIIPSIFCPSKFKILPSVKQRKYPVCQFQQNNLTIIAPQKGTRWIRIETILFLELFIVTDITFLKKKFSGAYSQIFSC